MRENALIDKSIVFATRIIKLHRYLIKSKKETIISKQIVRSGTSIGANINEANYGQSKADFVAKLHILRFGLWICALVGVFTGRGCSRWCNHEMAEQAYGKENRKLNRQAPHRFLFSGVGIFCMFSS